MNMRLCAALRLSPLTLTFSRPTTFSFLGNHLPLNSFPGQAILSRRPTFINQSRSFQRCALTPISALIHAACRFRTRCEGIGNEIGKGGPKLEDVQLGRAFAKTGSFQ